MHSQLQCSKYTGVRYRYLSTKGSISSLHSIFSLLVQIKETFEIYFTSKPQNDKQNVNGSMTLLTHLIRHLLLLPWLMLMGNCCFIFLYKHLFHLGSGQLFKVCMKRKPDFMVRFTELTMQAVSKCYTLLFELGILKGEVENSALLKSDCSPANTEGNWTQHAWEGTMTHMLKLPSDVLF